MAGVGGKWGGSHVQGICVTPTFRGVDFTGTTVGLARVSAMCSHSSGAVNQVRGSCPGLPGQGQSWLGKGKPRFRSLEQATFPQARFNA